MTDPVTLPTSKTVMDRTSITQYLLSDGRDPWNRAPLQLSDVIPNLEMKEKIEAWKAERMQQIRAEKAAAAATTEITVEDTAMDTAMDTS